MILRSLRLHLLLLITLSLTSLVLAAKPTSFCKCTCFSNSTIIQLGPPDSSSPNPLSYRDQHQHQEPHPHIALDRRDDDESNNGTSLDENSDSDSKDAEDDKKYRTLDCNDCNRKFCLDHKLPKCKGAKEEDVFTTCFQRDSSKDQIVVFGFIIATAGLLVWAAIKPWAEGWIKSMRERRSYLPIASQDDG